MFSESVDLVRINLCCVDSCLIWEMKQDGKGIGLLFGEGEKKINTYLYFKCSAKWGKKKKAVSQQIVPLAAAANVGHRLSAWLACTVTACYPYMWCEESLQQVLRSPEGFSVRQMLFILLALQFPSSFLSHLFLHSDTGVAVPVTHKPPGPLRIQ